MNGKNLEIYAFSNMLNFIEKDLIIRFLERNYPVSRIKVNFRFKRAILIDNEIFFLGDKKNHKNIKNKLVDVLFKVFNLNKDMIISIIDEFLPF